MTDLWRSDTLCVIQASASLTSLLNVLSGTLLQWSAVIFLVYDEHWQHIFKTGECLCVWYLMSHFSDSHEFQIKHDHTVYPKKYAHGFVVLCFVVVMQSFIMNSHEVFIDIHQGCFAGTGAIVRLPQCQWSKPDGYGKISQCITTTKHSKAKTVCIFLGIYCNSIPTEVD